MTQADRDRLVALKKAKKNLITQREAAVELELSIRQVQRLLASLKERGDKSIVHGLRGRSSNRKIDEKIEQQSVKILSAPVYEGFGPTLAAEYLRKKHGIEGMRGGRASEMASLDSRTRARKPSERLSAPKWWKT